MRKLLKKQDYAPDELVTDRLGSYGAARRELRLSARHEQGLRRNNRAENSHQAVRRQERKQQRFKSVRAAQRFLSMHAPDLQGSGRASVAERDCCGLSEPVTLAFVTSLTFP